MEGVGEGLGVSRGPCGSNGAQENLSQIPLPASKTQQGAGAGSLRGVPVSEFAHSRTPKGLCGVCSAC